MLRFDSYAAVPGLSVAAETVENEFHWGQSGIALYVVGYISSGTVDVGNSPTSELRPGLVVGIQTSTGQWSNYAAGNTDGTEVARGIIIAGLRMTDFQNVAQAKFYAICVGGPVQAAKCFGLDNQARQQMATAFRFDDDYAGAAWFDYKRQITKTTSFTVAASDNNTLFDNTGASGSIVPTLPPIANGLRFGFRCIAAQTIVITSAEGSNIVIDNNASASTATLAARIGTACRIFTNPAATKWIVEYCGSQGGANETIT
jgi:hypothetical protein